MPTAAARDAVLRSVGGSPTPSDHKGRIVAAALQCIARWGMAKTTLDDVAREAGLSRATVYRVFPGGKDRIVEAVLRHEAARFFSEVGSRLDAADNLEDLLVEGMSAAMRFIRDHEPFGYLLRHEPELVLPHISFHSLGRLLEGATAFCAPYLERFVPRDRAVEGAELVVRLVVSYSLTPSRSVDPDDPESIRRLARTFVLPALAGSTPIKEPTE